MASLNRTYLIGCVAIAVLAGAGAIAVAQQHQNKGGAHPPGTLAAGEASDKPPAPNPLPLRAPARNPPPVAAQPSAQPSAQASGERSHSLDDMDPKALEDYRRGLVETAFKAESADARWAHETRRAVDASLTSIGARVGARVETLECRSSICRAEVRLPSDDAYDRLLTDFIRESKWPAPGLATRLERPGGGTTMLLYLAREGTSLPEPE